LFLQYLLRCGAFDDSSVRGLGYRDSIQEVFGPVVITEIFLAGITPDDSQLDTSRPMTNYSLGVTA
jgi:hypothetical protein